MLSEGWGEDAKRRKIEEDNVEMKEECEPNAPVEVEEDAKPDKRAPIREAVRIDPSNTTLNVIPALSGKVLMPLTEGGLQYLLAGARASIGLKKGRYMFELNVMENLNPEERRGSGNMRPSVPRWIVRVGLSTQNSSLFLGDNEESLCFDSEGYFTADKRRTSVSEQFGRDDTIALVVNLETRSPNANTVSIFKNGIRAAQPQPIPMYLQGKVLFPHVNFKNVTVHINFGPTPMAPLPFSCRTVQEAAKEDVLELPELPRGSKYEVLFPVGIPDEGTFDWLDLFLENNPKYAELSDRHIMTWAEKSGLWRPKNNSWKSSNDKPDMNFGIHVMDDFSIQKILRSVVQTQPRNYIVMEVKSNLVREERADLMKRFSAPHYEKVAFVVMGDPEPVFKTRAQEMLLKEKQTQAHLEWRQRKLEKQQRKLELDRQRQLEEARRNLQEEAARRLEEAKKAALAEQAAAYDANMAQEAHEGTSTEVKREPDSAGEEAPAGALDAPKEEEKPLKCEADLKQEKVEETDGPADDEEHAPVVELTDEERQISFAKRPLPDIAMWVLSTSFTKFSLPEMDEGFADIRYAWGDAGVSRERLKTWILKQKILCRMENLQPSEWFRARWSEWQNVLPRWQAKQDEFRLNPPQTTAPMDEVAKPAEGDEAQRMQTQGSEESQHEQEQQEPKQPDQLEPQSQDNQSTDPQHSSSGVQPETEKRKDRIAADNIFLIEDVCDIGNGEPLFSRFSFEDWALLSLRVELHLLVHAFRKDAGDPERLGIHEQHVPFYYNRYFNKTLDIRYYGASTNIALIEMVRDTVAWNPQSMVIEPTQAEANENFDAFVRLTEERRRERQRRIDAGDETVRLQFGLPEWAAAAPPPPARVRDYGSRQWQYESAGKAKGGSKGWQSKGQAPPHQQGWYSKGDRGYYGAGGKSDRSYAANSPPSGPSSGSYGSNSYGGSQYGYGGQPRDYGGSSYGHIQGSTGYNGARGYNKGYSR